jgi:hypothetical protein
MAEAEKLSERLGQLYDLVPGYHAYFTDHGAGHVDRVWEVLQRVFRARPSLLTPLEKEILGNAVRFHDIGMAGPRVPSNPCKGAPETAAERDDIREMHEVLSEEFVKMHWSELGIPDPPTAYLIGRLCRSHRKKHYVRNVFPDEAETIGSEDVQVQLLAALLKLADALDTDFRRAPEMKERYFLDLPGEHKRHWEACQFIQGVNCQKQAIVLQTIPLPVIGRDAAEKIVMRKAALIFYELFLVLPFLVKAKIPWAVVEVRFRFEGQGSTSRRAAWEQWWYDELNAEAIRFTDLADIANHVRAHIRPNMPGLDIQCALQAIADAGRYSMPPPPRPANSEPQSLVIQYDSISTPECKASFLDSLRAAQEQIELIASDGLTFPEEVFEILGQKLLSKPPVAVTLFLLDPDALHEIEGAAENLDMEMARGKLQAARDKWREWWRGILGQLSKNPARRATVKKRFQVYFVRNPELGHLNGSVLIDDRILRLNVHRCGESASRGMLLHYCEPVNLLYPVRHYLHDMRRYGQQWQPDQDEEATTP